MVVEFSLCYIIIRNATTLTGDIFTTESCLNRSPPFILAFVSLFLKAHLLLLNGGNQITFQEA